MSDLEFVRRCVQAERGAWEEFVERYSRLVYNYIHSVFRAKGYCPDSPDQPKEIFHDIFVLLSENNFAKLKSYKAKNGCSLASWLRQVSINYTVDCLRKLKPTLSLDEENEDGFSLGEVIPADANSSRDIALEKEKTLRLKECIAGLATDDKLFLELYLWQGRGLGEVAKLMCLSRPATDMRKRRILERLRACFRLKGYLLDS
jgi:RNA polymerase sigma factor (sigma-70 family)